MVVIKCSYDFTPIKSYFFPILGGWGGRLNHVINKTKVLLPQAKVTLADFGFPV
jgi:hypothetical protein